MSTYSKKFIWNLTRILYSSIDFTEVIMLASGNVYINILFSFGVCLSTLQGCSAKHLTVCISKSIRCALLLVDSFEAKTSQVLLKNNLGKHLNFTFRYIDTVLPFMSKILMSCISYIKFTINTGNLDCLL